MTTIAAQTKYELERHKPMPSFNHGAVQTNLASELRVRYKKKFRVISELSIELKKWPSVPDICIYPKKPLDLAKDIVEMKEPPLCAIEIISPSQSLNELVTKANNYFKHGVESCWIVMLPLGNIHVFSAPGKYRIYQAHETLIDEKLGIELPLEEVFE